MTDLAEPRHIVVVDVETSALIPNARMLCPGVPWGTDPYGVVTEVAYWDLDTGENGAFVPPHDTRTVRAHGAVEALTVSRYLERLADTEQDDGTLVGDLHARLTGATLAGSNPAFDARFLRALFKEHDATKNAPEPWHHRLLDLSNVAATALGLPFSKLPGLAKVCELLDVDPRDAHTAAGDVRATGECLTKLGEMVVKQPAAATP